MDNRRTIPDTALPKLREIFGDDLVDSPEQLTTHGYDAANIIFRPEAVAYVSSAEQAAATLRLANRERFPVVPRGAGVGFSGGALPTHGGLVLNFTRMNRILAIDRENLTADVEPGVVTGQLHSAVEELGLFYPPDPASSDYCTIGGNIAENAGGPRAFKYGVTEHYVLGLEAVTPTGGLINAGGRTITERLRLQPAQAADRQRGHARHRHQGDTAPRAQAEVRAHRAPLLPRHRLGGALRLRGDRRTHCPCHARAG